MEYLYLVSTQEQLSAYQNLQSLIQPKMDAFLSFLRETYAVQELPRAIILTDYETSTHQISNIPVPAYTNDVRTVFCPDQDVWKSIYLQQLTEESSAELHSYYRIGLSWNSVLQILGHEFVHHSELFLENDYKSGIWFEEGMCEYISRKFFLTEAEFRQEARINALLVRQYESIHGTYSLEDFGQETYSQDFAGIFCGYWKSFLAVQTLIDQNNADVCSVFEEYHKWNMSGSEKTLAQWFGLE